MSSGDQVGSLVGERVVLVEIILLSIEMLGGHVSLVVRDVAGMGWCLYRGLDHVLGS